MFRKRPSLRITLFLVILGVSLVCIVASALLSNYLSNRQIEEFVKQHQEELAPSPVPGPPGVPQVPPAKPPQPRNINLGFILAGVLGLVLALALSFVLAGRISKPLSKLTAATRRIAGGVYEERVLVGGGREVEELGDAFNTLAESLDRNEQVRKNMVADIAHELRNPLATLRGQLELLQAGTIEYDSETIDSLMEDAVVLSRLVEDLRQLSIVEAGQLDLELAPVAVEDVLQEMVSRFKHETSLKHLVLQQKAEPGLPPISADRVRLGQVLSNLVANSIVHTPEGGSITVEAIRTDRDVTFTVRDTGSGVSGEDLPLLFERFYRTDRSRSRETGGAGLGLSIAKSMVEAHGGRIWIDSTAGKGTAIFFTIPI
jgi:signal transduction histidine kinase